MNVEVAIGKRFARAVTRAVVARPGLWRILRTPLRLQFERLAPQWDSMRSPGPHAVYEDALGRVQSARRALDVGTGTGYGALAIAARFPEAEVVGVDLAEAMIAAARAKLPSELARRVRLEVADASRLPFADASFDLVAQLNMIPFFDELARVLAPGGTVALAYSAGPQTPIWVPFDRVRTELSRRGFSGFAEIESGPGRAILAEKR